MLLIFRMRMTGAILVILSLKKLKASCKKKIRGEKKRTTFFELKANIRCLESFDNNAILS